MQTLKAYFTKHPLAGMRTIKTVISVILSSLFMQFVLGHNPFFACIGAVVAMERNLSQSIKAAVIRNVGTIVGGLVGIAIGSFTENIFIMAMGLIPLIWVCNAIDKKDSIIPGCIVYFAVFWLNTTDQAWSYGLTRILGTFIGSLISIGVNALILPQKKSEEDPGSPS